MKHIKLFESFLSLSPQDQEAIQRILAVADEAWFLEGDDAPDYFARSFEDFRSTNPEVEEAVEICTSGPSLTDVWLERNELISDVLREDPEITEEDIEVSNRNWFAEERARILQELRKL